MDDREAIEQAWIEEADRLIERSRRYPTLGELLRAAEAEPRLGSSASWAAEKRRPLGSGFVLVRPVHRPR